MAYREVEVKLLLILDLGIRGVQSPAYVSPVQTRWWAETKDLKAVGKRKFVPLMGENSQSVGHLCAAKGQVCCLDSIYQYIKLACLTAISQLQKIGMMSATITIHSAIRGT